MLGTVLPERRSVSEPAQPMRVPAEQSADRVFGVPLPAAGCVSGVPRGGDRANKPRCPCTPDCCAGAQHSRWPFGGCLRSCRLTSCTVVSTEIRFAANEIPFGASPSAGTAAVVPVRYNHLVVGPDRGLLERWIQVRVDRRPRPAGKGLPRRSNPAGQFTTGYISDIIGP
jgi:hypothetical protein